MAPNGTMGYVPKEITSREKPTKVAMLVTEAAFVTVDRVWTQVQQEDQGSGQIYWHCYDDWKWEPPSLPGGTESTEETMLQWKQENPRCLIHCWNIQTDRNKENAGWEYKDKKRLITMEIVSNV